MTDEEIFYAMQGDGYMCKSHGSAVRIRTPHRFSGGGRFNLYVERHGKDIVIADRGCAARRRVVNGGRWELSTRHLLEVMEWMEDGIEIYRQYDLLIHVGQFDWLRESRPARRGCHPAQQHDGLTADTPANIGQ